MKLFNIIVVAGALAVTSLAANAETVRVTALNEKTWSQFERGEIKDLTVVFRQGDEIPVSIRSEGDLLESTQVSPTVVRVKRDFYVRLLEDKVLMSLDGTTYKPFKDVLGGELRVGASSDENGGPVSGMDVMFKAILK